MTKHVCKTCKHFKKSYNQSPCNNCYYIGNGDENCWEKRRKNENNN